MKAVLATLTIALVVLYPVAIWIGLTHFSARVVGLSILALSVPALWARFRRASRADLVAVSRVPIAILAIVLLGVIFDDGRFVLAMPVLVSLALLAAFASSLFAERTIVERFARMQEARLAGSENPAPELSPAQVAHCRQVTWAWSIYFVLNAGAAGVLALFAPTSWWAAYSGGIAYAIMGLMFVGEYLLRQYRFRRYGRGLHDRVLSRILPPRGEERIG
jgi:uncharacterized membrane protein